MTTMTEGWQYSVSFDDQSPLVLGSHLSYEDAANELTSVLCAFGDLLAVASDLSSNTPEAPFESTVEVADGSTVTAALYPIGSSQL